MADLATHLNFTADLDRGVQLTELKPALLSGDVMAHRFVVDCLRGGKPVPLGGATVQGYFVRADETTVLIPGTTSGSAAVVTLPADCYAVPGRFWLAVRVTQGGVVNTVLWAQGNIGRASTATVTDPAAVLPTPEQVLAIIQRAEAAAVAAEAAAPGIIADAAGEVVAVTDAAARAPRSLRICGRTTQAATPTPDAPQPLTNAGESGSVAVEISGRNALAVHTDDLNLSRNGKAYTGNHPNLVNADGSITVNVASSGTYGLGFKRYLPAGAAVEISFRVTGIGNGESLGFTVWEVSGLTQHVSEHLPVGPYARRFTAPRSGVYVFGWMVWSGTAPCGASVADVQFSFTGGSYQPGAPRESLTLSIPGGLAGVPVASGGNTADLTGQAWLSDYVELADATRHTLLGSFTLDGSEGYAWSITPGSGFNVAYVGPQDKWADHDPALADDTRLLSTHFAGGLLTAVGQIKLDANFLNLSVPTTIATAADLNAWLAANPVSVLYVLAAPVITSVDAPAVTLPAPDAAILADGGCLPALDYLADTRLYIDQRLAALTAAVLSTGANI